MSNGKTKYILLFLMLAFQLNAQIEAAKISITGTTEEILLQLAELSTQPIVYNPAIFDGGFYSISYQEGHLDKALHALFHSRDYEIIDTESSFLIKKIARVSISGSIRQLGSLISLPYAAIQVNNKNIYTTSDENGRFQLYTALPAELIISYIGHRDTIVRIDQNPSDIHIHLEAENELNEIVITGDAQSSELLNRYNYSGDKIRQLTKNIPGIGGNDDLLHATRGIAGISSGSGGIGGYFIRGGSNSQNLFLIDGVSIYNPFHSFGLTSVVTADVSQNLKVFKSGFRARYADKSAGIIEIKIKEGNAEEHHIHGDINTQDASLSVQGPILTDHTSFYLSGRSTTLSGPFNNIIRNAIYGKTEAENGTDYYDLALKIKSQINQRNLLEFTLFKSNDLVNGEIEDADEIDTNEQRLQWGNEMFSLKWTSRLSDRLFTNFRISTNNYFTDYQFLNEFDDEEQNIVFIDNSSFNKDFNGDFRVDAMMGEKFRIQTGISFLTKIYSPNSNILTEDSDEIDSNEQLSISNLTSIKNHTDELKSDLWSWYSEVTFENNRHRLISGYRLNSYHLEDFNQIYFLPRVTYNYFINYRHKLEASFGLTTQYDHLLSLSDIFLPQDIWYPSTADLTPQKGWHYNAAHIYTKDQFTIRNEFFLKSINGITYSSYESLNNAVKALNLNTIQGESKVIGYEISAEYKDPLWQLLGSLSISKSTNQFDEINLGNEFPTQFDRRIEFNLIGSYSITDKLKIGLTNNLASGHPIFVADSANEELGLIPIDINPTGQKNQRRENFQHRIDLSLIYTFDTHALQHRIKANLYNSYNVSQPLYFTQDANVLVPTFSLPAIFSIAYSFDF